jgi:tryptophan synthase alpha chain
VGRIDDIFTALKHEGHTALMPFLAAGHPSLEATEATIRGLHAAGAHIVELGIPFSDPIADGPVIAAAMHTALVDGLHVDDVIDMARRVRGDTSLGLIAMVSSSIVEKRGAETLLGQLKHAGFDGIIVPDLDTDRADALLPIVDALDLAFALLIAPTTTDQRLEALLPRCRGFVYLLARAGVTGEQSQAPDIAAAVDRIRSRTDLPIAVGFGISTPEHVAAVTRHADAAIVGSAIVRRMTDTDTPAAAACDYVATLASGLAARN